MWMPMLLICGSVYAESCLVVTKNEDFYDTLEECSAASTEKANWALKNTPMYYVRPMCQDIKMGKSI